MTSLETIEDGLLRIADKIANFETITEENVEPFEALVLEAGTRRHKALILPLLLALDDHCEFNEVMFSLIHSVERFSRDDYFDVLAQSLPSIYLKAPKWCTVLHTRIINSEAAFTLLISKMQYAPQEVRLLERKILSDISAKERFRERCESGLQLLA